MLVKFDNVNKNALLSLRAEEVFKRINESKAK